MPPATASGANNDQLRVNFDITLPRVSCQYASVDLDDVMGHRRDNVTSNVMKWTIEAKSGHFKAFADAAPPPPQFRHSTSESRIAYVTGV